MRWLNEIACMAISVDALSPDAPLGIIDGCRMCQISHNMASGSFSCTFTEHAPRRKGESAYTSGTAFLTHALQWCLRMTAHTFGMPVDCIVVNDEDMLRV